MIYTDPKTKLTAQDGGRCGGVPRREGSGRPRSGLERGRDFSLLFSNLLFAQLFEGCLWFSFSVKKERCVGAAWNRETVFPAHAVGDAPENYVL